jgi:AcrR family transcriptional regulator
MGTTSKLSAEQRRAAIIRTARRVFADRGFHGTTTRLLAESAGVSEALLFKHFPTKEALFSAIQLSCCNEQDLGHFERLKSLEPSTSTLVLLVHFLVWVILSGKDSPEEHAVPFRLMLRSLAEDGDLARVLLRPLAEEWVPKVEQCVAAAVAAGDAVPEPVLPGLGAWFAQHITATILLHRLPATPVVDYALPREQLVEQAVWFTLRGLGLRDEAIRRYYNPAALALFAD